MTCVFVGEIRDDHLALFVIEPLQQHIHLVAENLVLEPIGEEYSSLAAVGEAGVEARDNQLRDGTNLVAVRPARTDRWSDASSAKLRRRPELRSK